MADLDLKALSALASRIRAHCVRMVAKANSSHIGSSLSCVDVLAYLYGHWLTVRPSEPTWVERDRFLMSKGHGAAALYAALAEAGYFPTEWLESYCCNGGKLAGHATHKSAPGVELSTGALGHGLPVAVGMALHAKALNKRHKVVCLLSDGECDEGSNWEALLFAPAKALGNLVAVIDYNKIQSYGRVDEVIPLEPLADKLRAMRWRTLEVNGHDFHEIHTALASVDTDSSTPTCVVAHTIKGKGVSFMEDSLAWHYKCPTEEQVKAALEEIGRA